MKWKKVSQSIFFAKRKVRTAKGFRFPVGFSQFTRTSQVGRLHCMNNRVKNKKTNVEFDAQLIMK